MQTTTPSEMTENMGDSWGRTPEWGHIHQLYCPPCPLTPPFFNSHYQVARRTRAGAASCRAVERWKERRGGRKESEMRKGSRWEDKS